MAGRAEYLHTSKVAGIDFDNPYRGDSETFASLGLDLKYRLSSNVTVDATVNPDFGQVEVDPAVINLTAFETRFEERRPFFVEGAEIFRFGEGGPMGSTGRAPEVLYSRRIGRVPQGSIPSSAVFKDAPAATTILGATKLTGKVGAGWSVGLLEAVTGRETARFVDPAGTQGGGVIEPVTNYLVARLRRDAEAGSTRVGAVFTAVNRSLSDPVLADRLHSAAYSAGVDLTHEWAGRMWRFSSSFNPSLVVGRAKAVTRTQVASTRYFNRPDADHLSVDSAATRLTGYYAMAEINKQAGSFGGRIAVSATSPGYEVNDIGFQTLADRFTLDTSFNYNKTRPGRILRSWRLGGGPDGLWNHDGQQVMGNFNIVYNSVWANYWGTGLRLEYIPETYDDRLTRGGPLSRRPRGWLASPNFSTDSRKRHTVGGSVTFSGDDGGSWQRNASLSVSLKPRENWEIQIGPQLTRGHAAAQYVTTVTDSLATTTFGRRYVFAALDQSTLGIETRINVTFSPTLSFEMYAQPFVSSGDYGTPKELRAPGTFGFLRYGDEIGTLTRQEDRFQRVDPDGSSPAPPFLVRDLDFNFRSLLGNAVVRWEWRPGSTLYVVWQQHREGTITGMDVDPSLGRAGNSDLVRDARELFSIAPDNIFAIKVNYWLNP